jgi:hypothetical protein
MLGHVPAAMRSAGIVLSGAACLTREALGTAEITLCEP